jgi:hypothetical protein
MTLLTIARDAKSFAAGIMAGAARFMSGLGGLMHAGFPVQWGF